MGRAGFVFWNASIQGVTNFGKQLWRNPKKGLTALASMYLLGALMPLIGGDDDDDEEGKSSYYDLPEYVRRSNILIRVGSQWISIPLPIEYRAIFGMGELMTSTICNEDFKEGGEIAGDIAMQLSQVLPIDLLEGDGSLLNLVPSSLKPIAESVANKDWTGLPLYKDTPFNKDKPEWTKAYSNANRQIVGITKGISKLTGGDDYKKGSVDINPAVVEHLLENYFGGIHNTIDKMVKSGEELVGAREHDPRNILLLNRVVKNGDERTKRRAVMDAYFRLKEEAEKTRSLLKSYSEEKEMGSAEYAEKLDFLEHSPKFARYVIFEEYKSAIQDYNDIIAGEPTEEGRKQFTEERNEIIYQLVQEIRALGKKK
jgi:hypothetical protein